MIIENAWLVKEFRGVLKADVGSFEDNSFYIYDSTQRVPNISEKPLVYYNRKVWCEKEEDLEKAVVIFMSQHTRPISMVDEELLLSVPMLKDKGLLNKIPEDFPVKKSIKRCPYCGGIWQFNSARKSNMRIYHETEIRCSKCRGYFIVKGSEKDFEVLPLNANTACK